MQEGQITALCVLPKILSSLFKWFSIFCCRCVLYWQVQCIHSCYPDKHVSRFEKANLFLLCQSQPMHACVFLSTQKCGLLGFTNSYWAGFQSPFMFCLFLDLEFNGNIWSASNVWLILAKNFLMLSIRSKPCISHSYPTSQYISVLQYLCHKIYCVSKSFQIYSMCLTVYTKLPLYLYLPQLIQNKNCRSLYCSGYKWGALLLPTASTNCLHKPELSPLQWQQDIQP